jgi:hypothetical protein
MIYLFMYDSTTENTVLNHISEGLLGTLQRVTEVACVYKPRECQLIQHNIPRLTFTKIFFCSQHLNGVILTEIKYPCFVQKKFSWKRVNVQGEKTRRIPQLL